MPLVLHVLLDRVENVDETSVALPDAGRLCEGSTSGGMPVPRRVQHAADARSKDRGPHQGVDEQSARALVAFAWGVDDEDVAAGSTRDALTHASPQESLEQAGLARTYDDQVRPVLLGNIHDLLDGLAYPSRELVLHGRRTEDTLDLRPVLTPECLVRALLFR
jgi:hypothetical protein